jgi:hypothetical protein
MLRLVLWEQLAMVGLTKCSFGDLRGVVHCGYCPVFKIGYRRSMDHPTLLFRCNKQSLKVKCFAQTRADFGGWCYSLSDHGP